MNYSAGAVSKVLILFLLFSSTTLFAQKNWEGDVDSNWNDPNNWAGNVGPVLGEDVIINPANYTNAPVLSVNSIFTFDKLTIQNGGTLSISADLTIVDNFTVDGGDASFASGTMSAGTLAITGGNKKKVDIKNGGKILIDH